MINPNYDTCRALAFRLSESPGDEIVHIMHQVYNELYDYAISKGHDHPEAWRFTTEFCHRTFSELDRMLRTTGAAH
jgi:hypothetical protein